MWARKGNSSIAAIKTEDGDMGSSRNVAIKADEDTGNSNNVAHKTESTKESGGISNVAVEGSPARFVFPPVCSSGSC
jgi:hypothetical protein